MKICGNTASIERRIWCLDSENQAIYGWPLQPDNKMEVDMANEVAVQQKQGIATFLANEKVMEGTAKAR